MSDFEKGLAVTKNLFFDVTRSDGDINIIACVFLTLVVFYAGAFTWVWVTK